MPRKIKIAWGEDGVDGFARVEFEDSQLDRWLEMLDREQTADNRGILQAWLQEIGTSLRGAHRQGPQAFTIKQAKLALNTFLASESVSGPLVMALNGRAEEAINNQLWILRAAQLAEGGSVVLDLMNDRIDEETLREAARRALAQLSLLTGRAKEVDIDWAVRMLCELWEAWTGRDVTLSNKQRLLEYTTKPTSQSGSWIAEVIEAVLPVHSAALVSSAMRRYIATRKNNRDPFSRNCGPKEDCN